MRRDLIGETLFQQFRVETFIAAGGMATIYRVWDLQRSVPLAMKVLHPELAADPAFIARFQREASSLQLLVHPHIVPFYGLYQAEDLTFLLERYIDGPSLDEVLRAGAGRPVPLPEALVYFKALYTSLGYAHAQGIIHCDVKPGNVLIDQGGHVYLTDFGIARYMDASTTTSSALGTPLYMAPEQIRGERVSPQTDMYSLGVVLFELLTGQRPFRGDAGVPDGVGPNPSDRIRYQHMYQAPPDPRRLNPDIPADVASVVLKAMAKDPGARYGTAAGMADALSMAVAARFDSLPDRVSLPGPRRGFPPLSADTQQPAAAPPPPAGVFPENPYPAGQPGRNVPSTAAWAGQPGAQPRAARPRRDRRRLALLLGLLGAMVVCLLAGAQLAQTFWRSAVVPPGGRAPTASPGDAATPTFPTNPTTPAPGPTESASPALANFPVDGELAIVRHVDGTARLFLYNAATGGIEALPSPPNVEQREVSAPQWSPDGQRLTWIGQYTGRPHVIAMDMENRVPYQLPAGEAYARLSSPAFLPGGDRVSFWASNGGQNALVTADAVTGEALDTTNLPGYRNMFVWNWSGGQAAFIYQGQGSYKVGVSTAPGGGVTPVDPGGEGYAPAWSNDGAWLAFQSDRDRDPGMNEIWIARADGSQMRPVTVTPEGYWSRAPTWSPDGRMIAFVSNRSGSRGADYGELFVVDLETGAIRQMTDTGGNVYDWRPAWRP
jgi:serine/threonine-protein kinase